MVGLRGQCGHASNTKNSLALKYKKEYTVYLFTSGLNDFSVNLIVLCLTSHRVPAKCRYNVGRKFLWRLCFSSAKLLHVQVTFPCQDDLAIRFYLREFCLLIEGEQRQVNPYSIHIIIARIRTSTASHAMTPFDSPLFSIEDNPVSLIINNQC